MNRKANQDTGALAPPPEALTSVESYVAFCAKAREEAYHEAKEAGFGDRDCEEIANISFRCVLPIMSTRLAVQAFIACVAVAQARQWIKPEECRALSYTAQLAMSSLREVKK